MATALLSTRGARATPVTLKSLEEKALTRRANVDAERARASRARAQVDLARASGYPTLSFDADTSLAPGDSLITVRDVDGHDYRVVGSRPLGTAGAFTPEVRYGASLVLEGTIYDFGRTSGRIDAARAGSQAVRADAAAARAAVLTRVRQAYLDWIVARAAADIAARAADNARARRKAVQGYVDEGKRPPADLLAARLDEAEARLDRVEAQGRAQAARLALEGAVGTRLPSDAEPDASLLDAAPPAPSRRPAPQLLALERRRDAALAEARSHAGPWTPVLSGTAGAGVYAQRADVFPAFRLGISLVVPLWDGGAESARRDAARARAAELSARAGELRSDLASSEAAAHAAWRNAHSRVEVAKQFDDAAEAALRSAEERYNLGKGSVEAIIKARTEETRAALRLLQARGARAGAVLRLRALDGAADR